MVLRYSHAAKLVEDFYKLRLADSQMERARPLAELVFPDGIDEMKPDIGKKSCRLICPPFSATFTISLSRAINLMLIFLFHPLSGSMVVNRRSINTITDTEKLSSMLIRFFGRSRRKILGEWLIFRIEC